MAKHILKLLKSRHANDLESQPEEYQIRVHLFGEVSPPKSRKVIESLSVSDRAGTCKDLHMVSYPSSVIFDVELDKLCFKVEVRDVKDKAPHKTVTISRLEFSATVFASRLHKTIGIEIHLPVDVST